MANWLDFLNDAANVYAMGKDAYDAYKRRHPPKPTFSQRLVKDVTREVKRAYYRELERQEKLK